MKKYHLAGFYIIGFVGQGEKEFLLFVLCIDYITEYLFFDWFSYLM